MMGVQQLIYHAFRWWPCAAHHTQSCHAQSPHQPFKLNFSGNSPDNQSEVKRTLLSGYIKSVAKLCNIQINGRFLVNALEIEYNTTLEASLYFFSPQIFLFGVQAAFSEK